MKNIYLTVKHTSIYIIILLMLSNIFAKTTANRDASVELDKKTEKTLFRALEAVAGYQRKNGSFSPEDNIGISSIAILALMASGSIPGEGKFAREIGKGIKFLIKSQKDNGIIYTPGTWGGPMYHHALGTQVLAECLGMTLHPDIRKVTIKAADFIVHAQDKEGGGWRYQPLEEGDMSVTVMQVMALKAASKGGIYVPAKTIERGIKFIKSCYVRSEGGFGYMSPKKPEFPRTAAGLVCLYTVGLHNDKTIPDIVEYIMDNAFDPEDKHFCSLDCLAIWARAERAAVP